MWLLEITVGEDEGYSWRRFVSKMKVGAEVERIEVEIGRGGQGEGEKSCRGSQRSNKADGEEKKGDWLYFSLVSLRHMQRNSSRWAVFRIYLNRYGVP